VALSVRHSNGETEDVTVTRATIVIPTVFTNPLEDADGNPVSDLAYVDLEQITEKTVPDLRNTVAEMVDQGYRGIILDLRRNPGGSLSATVDIADLFLDGGRILTQVDREGNETSFDAHPGDVGEDIPLVLLVGPGSASGAEVIAGALRDHQRAVLVGETTFGKGSVNHLRELSDGGAIYITIARGSPQRRADRGHRSGARYSGDALGGGHRGGPRCPTLSRHRLPEAGSPGRSALGAHL
jgi:carboxyl-terminal processing protease